MIRILIVDDEEVGRHVMEEIFSQYGTCIAVSSGYDGITAYRTAMAEKNLFNLVLLDISMEPVSGLEVLKQIKILEKKIPDIDHAVVFMVTSHSEKDIVLQSINLGCRGYFIKPLKAEVVARKMSEFGFVPIEGQG